MNENHSDGLKNRRYLVAKHCDVGYNKKNELFVKTGFFQDFGVCGA